MANCCQKGKVLMTHVFREAGFVDTYIKPDPRGKEYGYFEAKTTPDDKIKVVYQPSKYYIQANPRGFKYCMLFESQLAFKNWARECT